MLTAPSESPYDLNFKLCGFHVRVSWSFWLMAAVLGWSWSQWVDYIALVEGMTTAGPVVFLVIWALALLASITVHELGHAFAFQYYGLGSRIVLYHFGGLAIPDSFGAWNGARQARIGAREQLVIAAAGPAFQLGLAAIVWSIGYAANLRMELSDDLNWLLGTNLPMGEYPSSAFVYAAFEAVLYPSTVWAIFNLAPILPLDGGHIMKSLLQINNVNQPTRTAHMVSIGVGAVLGFYCFTNQLPGGIMFLLFAASNWQALQTGYGSF